MKIARALAPKLNKSKIGANALTAILLTSLFIATMVGFASVSQKASAQPPYPVPNVSVTASGDNGEGGVLSNAQGQYNISSYLGTGNYTLDTYAEGYISTEVHDIQANSGQITSGINIMIAVSGVITGKVTAAATGSPLPFVLVTAYNSTGDGSTIDSTLTDTNGNYRLDTDMPTGTYNVTANPWLTGLPCMSQNATLISVTAGTITSGINIALPKSGAITGTVTSAVTKSPISGIIITADSSNGAYSDLTTTNSTGQYTLDTNLGTNNNYTVSTFFPTNYLDNQVTNVSVTQGLTTSGVNLALQPSGIITGKVTQPNGTPISGADVTAYDATFTYFGSATTNSTGQYQITSGIGTGNYTVEAYYAGISNSTTGVSVTQGLTKSGVNFQLTIPASGTIKGRVTDTHGKPIEDATVTAENTATTKESSNTTDSSGDYIISLGLSTGTYNVTATSDEYTPELQTGIAVTVNAVTTVNFQLTYIPSGAILGIVQTEQLAVLPSPTPTVAPTATPTVAPTATPTVAPTATPTAAPTATPTSAPTATPTTAPTTKSTSSPSASPSPSPTIGEFPVLIIALIALLAGSILALSIAKKLKKETSGCNFPPSGKLNSGLL